jgi:hypothetical protein
MFRVGWEEIDAFQCFLTRIFKQTHNRMENKYENPPFFSVEQYTGMA